MKFKLSLLPVNGGAFNCRPAFEVELPDEQILCNDVTLPWEFNPHKTRLFVIGHEFGALAAVWADCEQEAFDALVDEGYGDCFLIDESEADEYCARLGNAGEPANLDYAWVQVVRLDETKDCRLLCAFAEARGNQQTTLDK